MERFLRWLQWTGLWCLSLLLMIMANQAQHEGDTFHTVVAFIGSMTTVFFLVYVIISFQNRKGDPRG